MFSKLIKAMKSQKEEKTIFKYPHEIFPEILLWEVGDEIEDWRGLAQEYYTFRKVTEKGEVFLWNKLKRDMHEISINEVGELYNKSLNTRQKEEKMEDDDYCKFIEDFKKEYKKLKGG